MADTVIKKKLAVAIAHPYEQTFDGEPFILYDEVNDWSLAQEMTVDLLENDYKAMINPRMIDDIMAGRFYRVYDIYVAKSSIKGEQK